MPSRNGMIPLAITVILLATAAARAADEQEPTIEEKISQVLLHTQKGREVDYPPTREVIQQFRNGAPDTVGKSWGFTLQKKVDDVDVARMHSITILPVDYVPSETQQARWNQFKMHAEPATGLEVAFREAKRGSVRRHQVTYRLQSGQYRLLMQVTTSGNESAAQAMQKTRDDWDQFFGFAKSILGDPEPAQIFVTITEPVSTEPTGVEDGEVFNVDNDQTIDVRADFQLSAVAEFLESGKPYDLRLKTIKHRGDSGITVRGSSLSAPDAQGWQQLRVADLDSQASLTVTLAKFDAAVRANEPPETDRFVEFRVQLLDPKSGDVAAEFRFGVQRRDWFPIVQRFQLIGRNYRERGPDGKEISPLIPKPERLSFNQYVEAGGTLLQNYRRLVEPIATQFGEIKATDPVCLGWRADNLDVKQVTDFLVAVDAPDVETKLPVLLRDTGVRHVVDIRLWRAPLIQSVAESDSFFGDDLLGGFEELLIDPDKEELRLRQDLYLKSYSLTVIPIEFTPKGEAADAFLANLPARWRQPPLETEHRAVAVFPGKTFTKLEDYLPQSDRYADPRNIPDSTTTTRISGVFQLRLVAEFYHVRGTKEDAKKVDVALRYAVAPDGFDAHVIFWKTQRQER